MIGVFFFCFLLANVWSATYVPVTSWTLSWFYITGSIPDDAAYLLTYAINGQSLATTHCGICVNNSGTISDLLSNSFIPNLILLSSTSQSGVGDYSPITYETGISQQIAVVCFNDPPEDNTPCGNLVLSPQTTVIWRQDPFQTQIEVPPVVATPTNRTTVLVKWIGPSVYKNFPTQNYTIDWSLDSNFNTIVSSATLVIPPESQSTSPPPENTQSINVTSLITGSHYYFRVLARNKWYTTPYSTANAIVGDRPDPPTALSLTVVDTTSFRVDWTNGTENGATVTAFNLKCGTDSAITDNVNDFLSIQKNGTVSGFVTGKTYYCKLNAVNSFGTSIYSNPPATQLLATKPTPATTPTVTATSPTNFQVSFSPSGGNGADILDYRVEYSTDSSFQSGVSQINFTDATTPHFATVPAPAGTANVQYFFRVFSRNVVGTSDPSSSGSGTLFAAPSFTNNTITTNSTGSTPGSSPNSGCKDLVMANTLGGQWVNLTGNGFTSYGAPTVTYSNGLYTDNCLNPYVVSNALLCQIKPGSGTHFRFSVKSGSVVGQAASGDTLSFPGPQITDRTLRRNGGTNIEPLPAERDSPELLYFDGKNFGPSQDGATVKYGPSANPTKFDCAIRGWSESTISCETDNNGLGSQERNMHFTVIVRGQNDSGLDTYNYPTTPGIWSVSGCTGTGCEPNATCGCPTNGGGVLLTIKGENFTEPLAFTIRGSTCGNVNVNAAQHLATCVLPEGTGINLQVRATQGSFESTANLVSYALPVLTAACGCASGCGGTPPLPVNCSRTDGSVITVTGTNLGKNGATIFVGGTPCNATTLVTEHTTYNCTVPLGAGKDRVISLFQNAGEISVTQTVTMSYEVCPPGTYANGVECTECPAGTANPLSDQPKCVACAVGRYQNLTGKLVCPACMDGAAQGSTGQTKCDACTVGLFAAFDDNLGSPICNPCPPGRYTNNNATSLCHACPGGQYQNETGATSCTNCTAGQKPSPGSISCLECDSGTYNPVAGNVAGCLNPPLGTIALKSATGRGATNYSDCDEGTTSSKDQTSCTPCSPGRFGNVTRADECMQCSPGYYTNVPKSTVCSQCTGGTFNNYNAASLCFGCDTGTFSGDGAATCTKCSIGFYGPDVNATECLKCANGTSSGLGFSNCTACGTGRYSNGSVVSALCDPCQAGTFAQNQSSVKCDDCTAGKASKSASQVCTVCGVGFFSNQTRAADCLSCAPGSFTDSQERAFCTLCYPGYYAAANGSRICRACGPGYYQPNNGGLNCPQCPAGRYTVDDATKECHTCPDGQVANPNALGCLDLYYQTNAVKFFFLVMALCCLGVTVGSYVGLVVFRDHRVIHHSQPLILWVMLFGFALVFVSVILYIWDQTNAMCIFRNITLNLGVSIVIVPLTLKTWRLHRIFNRSKTDAIQTVVIKDWVLVVIFGVVLLYDIITFIAWSVTAPFSVWTLIGRCDSTAEPWIHAVLWWWKPVCCLYLAYLVYRVRDIDERFNEAWWIGIALYNAVVVLAVFAVLTYTLDLTPRKWYIMFVVIIIYLGLTTWGLIYWVKWYQIYRKDTENERMLGNAVANDIADAEEVINDEKEDVKEEEQEKKKGLDPDKGDEQLTKLHKNREKKARELQKLLQIVERTKTRMKTDMTNLNRYTSELLAMQQEIEYRKRMLEKKGVAVPPPPTTTAAPATTTAPGTGKDKGAGDSSDYSSGTGATGATGSDYDKKGADDGAKTGAGYGTETAAADGGYNGDKDPEPEPYTDRSPSGDGEDTFVA